MRNISFLFFVVVNVFATVARSSVPCQNVESDRDLKQCVSADTGSFFKKLEFNKDKITRANIQPFQVTCERVCNAQKELITIAQGSTRIVVQVMHKSAFREHDVISVERFQSDSAKQQKALIYACTCAEKSQGIITIERNDAPPVELWRTNTVCGVTPRIQAYYMFSEGLSKILMLPFVSTAKQPLCFVQIGISHLRMRAELPLALGVVDFDGTKFFNASHISDIGAGFHFVFD